MMPYSRDSKWWTDGTLNSRMMNCPNILPTWNDGLVRVCSGSCLCMDFERNWYDAMGVIEW